MTLKIEVTIPEQDVREGSAADYLTAAMSAIGFSRLPQTTWLHPAAATSAAVEDALARTAAASAQATAEALEDNARPIGDDSPLRRHAVAETPKRERGKPAQGRARRTKEEIAEDEAADKADAGAAFTAEEAPMISTGEERIDPTTAEDAAQDAADEAAEVEEAKAAELSHDDVRAALQKYLTAYGTPAAMEDGPKVLTLMFGAEVTKVSAVPADQASLVKAVAGIEEMLVKNPYKREAQL